MSESAVRRDDLPEPPVELIGQPLVIAVLGDGTGGVRDFLQNLICRPGADAAPDEIVRRIQSRPLLVARNASRMIRQLHDIAQIVVLKRK